MAGPGRFRANAEQLPSSKQILSVAPPAEPRGEKKLFFVQILGGEKLLKFGENGR